MQRNSPQTTPGLAIRLVMTTLATLLMLGGPAAGAVEIALPGPNLLQKEGVPLGTAYGAAECAAKNGGAVPITLVGDADGANRAVLYQDPRGRVFVSWLMVSEMAIGADTFVFGIALAQPDGSAHLSDIFARKVWEGPEYKSSPCRYVGTFAPGVAMEYKIIGGAAGWQETSSCSFTHSWKVRTGAELNLILIAKLLLGTGKLYGEVEFGQSTSCSDGVTYDSEVLIGQAGSTIYPLGGDGSHVRPYA